jgi:ribosomal protein S12 methylthiotransferase
LESESALPPFSKTVRMISLGCPKNLVDSEVMLGLLQKEGWIPSLGEEAEVVVINTCGFIREAQEESIETILAMISAKAEGKLRKVVVTGCLPQRFGPQLMRELPEVDLFLGAGEFHRIAHHLKKPGRGPARSNRCMPRPEYLYDHRTPRLLTSAAGWAYIKISEGCNNHCSYCTIPGIRGKLRSRRQTSIVQEAKQMVSRGIREINLIAQDTTAYGRDLGQGTNLPGLLRKLVQIEGLEWIRLLYAHPRHITGELLALMAEEEKICKYLDIPLQHIDDRMLQAMNRGVSSRAIQGLLDQLRERIPGIILRTSLMVGFPGETDKRFDRLLDFVRKFQFERLGVFRYSREQGTRAAKFPGQVSEAVKLRRYHRVMALQKEISRQKQKRLVGRRLPVLVDRPGKSAGILWEGRTPGQAPEVDGLTLLTKGRCRPGEVVEAVITKATAYDLYGEVIDPSGSPLD